MNDPTTRATLTIAGLLARYREGSLTPARQVQSTAARLAGGDPHHAWIRPLTRDEMMRYADALQGRDPASLPLYGVPFAIKDNIDLAGIPTTAACPGYAYVPRQSAPVVERLIAAGAIPVGKTNLDQFATGLSGQRSPYGACRNALDMRYASGGSSSGSAVSVALGVAAFSLGTDTAGSGRVPAAFHGLIGLKPTKGVLSTQGVVPACKSLDCVTVFAHTVDDAQTVFHAARGVADGDPYGRAWSPRAGVAARRAPGSLAGVRLGVPRAGQLEFFGDESYRTAFAAALERARALGARLVEIDFEPFLAAARLLYEGPWVAERLAAIGDFYRAQPGALHPVVRQIIGGAARWSAADAFAAFDRLAGLRLASSRVWPAIDAIFMPTSATTATVDELEADPIGVNARFGYYTNFVNLLDLSAIAVPAGNCAAGRHAGLPFGMTFVGRAHDDAHLLGLSRAWLVESEDRQDDASGAVRGDADKGAADTDTARVRVAVVGAHLSGQPLNGQLTEPGAVLLATTRTAPAYRLHLLPQTDAGAPAKPGLVRVREGGAAIEVEVWAMPVTAFGSFVARIPAPMGIGAITLENGEPVPGFLCEHAALEDAPDITAWGGWRAWLARQAAMPAPAPAPDSAQG